MFPKPPPLISPHVWLKGYEQVVSSLLRLKMALCFAKQSSEAWAAGVCVSENDPTERREWEMLNNAAQSCRLFGYRPENESNFSFCHYKYFSANGTDFLQLWLSKGPLSEYLKKKRKKEKGGEKRKKRRRKKKRKEEGREKIKVSSQLILYFQCKRLWEKFYNDVAYDSRKGKKKHLLCSSSDSFS